MVCIGGFVVICSFVGFVWVFWCFLWIGFLVFWMFLRDFKKMWCRGILGGVWGLVFVMYYIG